MRYKKYPQPTIRDLVRVMFAVLTSAEKTTNPTYLSFGGIGGDSTLGRLRAYIELREYGVLYVDDHFQIRLTDSPLANLLAWLCVFNCKSFLRPLNSIGGQS